MKDPADESHSRFVQKLIEGVFEKYVDWKPIVETAEIGPYDQELCDVFQNDVRKTIEIVRDRLTNPANKLVDPYLVDLDDPRHCTFYHWKNVFKEELGWLINNEPKWYLVSLAHPSKVPDLTYWQLMPKISADEATHLSIGLEPGTFSEDELNDIEESPSGLATFEYIKRRRQLIRRVFHSRKLGNGMDFTDLVRWISGSGLEAPKALLDFATALDIEPKSVKPEDGGGQKRSHKREIDSISQLFVAMAIEYYGYDPRSARSPIPKEIANLCADLGIDLTDETVRKYLRRGAQFIPKDWSPK